jgi:peptidoglycan/xylan/chitin deacetylase (PgdA/CDA1 family)
VFTEIGRTLAGCYDDYFLKKDDLGIKLRAIPVVDVLEDTLYSAINSIMPEQSVGLSSLWPEGHKFALVLTHDVDRVYKTYQYLPSILKSLKKASLPDLAYHFKNLLFRHGKANPYWMFEYMMDLEDSLGVKSTYYFLNEKGKIKPFSLRSWVYYAGRYDIEASTIKEKIRKLEKTGFEIGVHGSFNSYNNAELLLAEKRTLESITGSGVTGIRQHYLNYDRTTSQIQYQCGFKYYTTIGYKPDSGIGFRRGTSFPFPVMLPDMTVSPLLEIPLIIMDSALGSTWNDQDCFRLLNQVEKHHGVLTILWHTNIFNSRDYPGMTDLYVSIINEARQRGAWVVRAIDLFHWMTESAPNAVNAELSGV